MAALDSGWQDLRFAARQLARSRGFAVVAVLTLGLGIGANTAIFTVVDTVLLRPLPFAQPDRLVQVTARGLKTGELRNWDFWRDAADWRERNRAFERMGSFAFALLNLTGTDRPEALYGSMISWDLLPTLGVRPALGRNFLPEEDRPGRNQVILLSHQLWIARFGGDRAIVGRHIRLRLVSDRTEGDYLVAGVMPPDFNFPLAVPSAVSLPSRQMAYWIPFGIDPARVRRDGRACMVVGRLKPGWTLAQAQSDMDAVAAGLARQYPDTNRDRGVRLAPLLDHVLGRTRVALLILLGSTGLLLLIACANLANLLLARAANRRREIAVRMALGAGRARLVRQWLTESLLLAALGGALGCVLASFGTDALLRLAPADIPRLAQSRLDASALLFNLAVSLVAALLFGVLPAWRAAGSGGSDAIHEGGLRSTEGPARSRTRNILIVAEVALSLVLVTAAGLLARSVAGLLALDTGFRPDRVLASIIVLPRSRYPDAARAVSFYRKLLERVEAIPGVESAGAVDGVPLSGNISSEALRVEGRPAFAQGENRQWAEAFSVSENYLRTMGISLVGGRELSRHDAASGFRAVLINEAAARQYWPGERPLGRRLGFDGTDPAGEWRQVVGIVKNTQDLALDTPAKPAVYVPMEQSPTPPQFLAVRTSAAAAGFAPALRDAVAAVDKDQPVFVVTPMQEMLDNAIAPRRFAMHVLIAFGVLSLVLAAVGLYGVVSYAVARRTREIGLRMALGATRMDILRLVLGQSAALTAAGLGAGMLAALALMRALKSLLYGVEANDLPTVVAACAVLGLVAMAAAYLPARHAMQVDAAAALRQD